MTLDDEMIKACEALAAANMATEKAEADLYRLIEKETGWNRDILCPIIDRLDAGEDFAEGDGGKVGDGVCKVLAQFQMEKSLSDIWERAEASGFSPDTIADIITEENAILLGIFGERKKNAD